MSTSFHFRSRFMVYTLLFFTTVAKHTPREADSGTHLFLRPRRLSEDYPMAATSWQLLIQMNQPKLASQNMAIIATSFKFPTQDHYVSETSDSDSDIHFVKQFKQERWDNRDKICERFCRNEALSRQPEERTVREYFRTHLYYDTSDSMCGDLNSNEACCSCGIWELTKLDFLEHALVQNIIQRPHARRLGIVGRFIKKIKSGAQAALTNPICFGLHALTGTSSHVQKRIANDQDVKVLYGTLNCLHCHATHCCTRIYERHAFDVKHQTGILCWVPFVNTGHYDHIESVFFSRT